MTTPRPIYGIRVKRNTESTAFWYGRHRPDGPRSFTDRREAQHRADYLGSRNTAATYTVAEMPQTERVPH
jgi:hypothetical protein